MPLGPEFLTTSILARATQAAAWKAFLADPEWVAIKKATSEKYGDLVDDVQDRSLDMLPYTPLPSQVP